MITLSIVFCILSFFIGYYLGRKDEANTVRIKKNKAICRCEALIERVITNPTCKGHAVIRRCELDSGHLGPHMYVVPAIYDNGGEEVWWADNDK